MNSILYEFAAHQVQRDELVFELNPTYSSYLFWFSAFHVSKTNDKLPVRVCLLENIQIYIVSGKNLAFVSINEKSSLKKRFLERESCQLTAHFGIWTYVRFCTFSFYPFINIH